MTQAKSRSKSRDGQGSVQSRELRGGTVVWDAWAPSMIDPLSGKTKRPAKRGHATEREAWAWISRQVADNAAGLKVMPIRGDATVTDAWRGWVETTPLKESTVAEYGKIFDKYAATEIGQAMIATLKQSDIDRMISGLHKQGVPATQLSKVLTVLKHAWTYAKTNGDVSSNIVADSSWTSRLGRDVRNQKAERDEMREEEGTIPVLLPSQLQSLIETDKHAWRRVIWEFIAHTGMRRAEVCSLRWEDVYLDKGHIWIRLNIAEIGGELIHLDTPKGNKRRKIQIPPSVVDLLRRWKEILADYRKAAGDTWEENGLVFPIVVKHWRNKFNPGHWMAPQALSKAFYGRAKELGLPSTRLHSLRYTWASAAFVAGIDIKVIQDHLGHKLDITTLIYIQRDEASKQAAVVRVVDYLRATA